MAKAFTSFTPLLNDGNIQTFIAAPTGSNKIEILRMKILHVGADGSAPVTVDVWKGSTTGDIDREVRSVVLSPGQSLRWGKDDLLVLEAGEALSWRATGGNNLACISGDGFLDTP